MNILTEHHLLPANATDLEKALSAAPDLAGRLGPPADAIATFKTLPPDPVLPFLIWEYGLGELQPFIPDQRRLIREGVQWQRIRGTPAAIHKALSWLDLRVTIEEEGGGPHWAEFQLGVTGVLNVTTLQRLVTLVRLSKPARCRLWRIYNDELDERPGVWSGPLPWSAFVWTYYSGASVPGVGDDDLIVSFGAKHSAQSEPYLPEGMAGSFGGTTHVAFIVPYRDKFLWGRSPWSEVHPPSPSFAIGQIYSCLLAERQTMPYGWKGRWDTRHWLEVTGWDRNMPSWTMNWRSMSKSQHCWAWPDDEIIRPFSSGTWGDINASYGLPQATLIDAPPVWGAAAYSEHDQGRRELTIHERFQLRESARTQAIAPGAPAVNLGSAFVTGLPKPEVSRVGVDVHSTLSTHTETIAPAPPLAAVSSVCAALTEPCHPQAPLVAVHSTFSGATAPQRNQTWTGRWDKRRWWDYVAYARTSTAQG